MKKKLIRWWYRFHSVRIQKIKLRFAHWWHNRNPQKYCWTDCVSYAFAPDRFNPWKIDNSKGCETESKGNRHACYCGGWVKGKCFSMLTDKEQDELRNSL